MQRAYIFTLVFLTILLGCSQELPLSGLSIPQDESSIAKGKIIVQGLGSCGFCHGQTAQPGAPLSGGRSLYDTYGEVKAPNITPAKSGVGGWTAEEIIRAIRASVGPNDREFSTELHSGYEWLSNGDALAVTAYLRALQPIEHTVPHRNLSFIDRNTTGLFLSRGREVGFVPELDKRFQVQYGGYLVEHVARCIQCHNGPTTLFGGEEYLGGGRHIKTEAGEKIAPGITASEIDGIGTWKEEDIVVYLRTGRTPKAEQIDSGFCPVNFYKNAPLDDLQAIAKFLKSLKRP